MIAAFQHSHTRRLPHLASATGQQSPHTFTWKKGNLLGEGQYKVFQVLNEDTGEQLAAKELPIADSEVCHVAANKHALTRFAEPESG